MDLLSSWSEPHGGPWERMIRSVRQVLKALLKEQVVCDEVLSTVPTEAANILTERISATDILCRSGADVDLQDRNGRTALHLAKDVECVCLILAYHGDPSIETVFGKTALITAAENQRWDICRALYDAQAVVSLGALSRGPALFCAMSRDHQAWLIKCSRKVRSLSHLCRCVLRKQFKIRCKNIFEGARRLPLPTPLQKAYFGTLSRLKSP